MNIYRKEPEMDPGFIRKDARFDGKIQGDWLYHPDTGECTGLLTLLGKFIPLNDIEERNWPRPLVLNTGIMPVVDQRTMPRNSGPPLTHNPKQTGSGMPRAPRFSPGIPWFIRQRLPSKTSVILFVVTIVSILILLFAFLHQASGSPSWFMGFNLFSQSSSNQSSPAQVLNASVRVVARRSEDRNEYSTDYRYNVWSFSSCSGFAFEEVMEAWSYAKNLNLKTAKVDYILDYESSLGVWDSYNGIKLTKAYPAWADVYTAIGIHYGYKTRFSDRWTLNQIIAIANMGFPVIVGIEGNLVDSDGNAFPVPGGHILVVTGGDGNIVRVADSTPTHARGFSYAWFLKGWKAGDHFGFVMTPPWIDNSLTKVSGMESFVSFFADYLTRMGLRLRIASKYIS